MMLLQKGMTLPPHPTIGPTSLMEDNKPSELRIQRHHIIIIYKP